MKSLLYFFFFFLSALLYPEEKEEAELLMGSSFYKKILEKEETLFWEKCCDKYLKRGLISAFSQREKGIPKIIHFIWLGPKPFPPKSVENVRSWMAHHPDWAFKFWTDRDQFPPCEEMEVCLVKEFPFQFCKDCFGDSKNPGEQSDLLRFEILYKEGGIYVDHDADCLQSFESLHNVYQFYAGFETIHPPVVGCQLTLGNGVIGSIPKHPLIRRVMEMICADWDFLGHQFRGSDGYTRTQRVMQRTYIKLTEAVKEAVREDRLEEHDMIFPAAYFFAKEGLSPLYSTHFFANAWADDQFDSRLFRKEVGRLVHRIKALDRHLIKVRKGFALLFSIEIGILIAIRSAKSKRKQKRKTA